VHVDQAAKASGLSRVINEKKLENSWLDHVPGLLLEPLRQSKRMEANRCLDVVDDTDAFDLIIVELGAITAIVETHAQFARNAFYALQVKCESDRSSFHFDPRRLYRSG
jgi:hypothetical protein